MAHTGLGFRVQGSFRAQAQGSYRARAQGTGLIQG